MHYTNNKKKRQGAHRFTGDYMRKDDNFEFSLTAPIISSLFDDMEHGILSPLSCLQDFNNYWMLEFDLPLVNTELALWSDQ